MLPGDRRGGLEGAIVDFSKNGWRPSAGLFGAALIVALTIFPAGSAGQDEKPEIDKPLAEYRARMAGDQQQTPTQDGGVTITDVAGRSGAVIVPRVRTAEDQGERSALIATPGVDNPPAPEELLAQIPDLSEANTIFAQRLARIEQSAREPRVVNQYRRVIEKAQEYLADAARPEKVDLSLSECVYRALNNNYAIRAESYTPAISRARLVEAEAAFDAAFFLDFNYSNVDQQSSSELSATQNDSRSYSGGIRKLLPTGMQAQISLQQSRTFTNFQFQTLNPAYDTRFTASFTQPLLKGFGLDYNRAGIELARADLRISHETLVQQVRDQLLAVEQAYWQLVSARRTAMVLVETTSQNWVTYQSMVERSGHDATPVEINNSKSQWQGRVVDYIEALKQIRDAEDKLKNLMNDPDFKLSDDIEIVPTETPLASPLALDQFAEVRTALDNRSEIKQARVAIEQSRIRTGRAKNETLPKLDLSFQYDVQGIGPSADRSFDNVTTNRYRSYSVGATFSYPIGNRGPRAAHRRSKLEESRAVVQLRRVIDAVVEEVNGAVRLLIVRYTQVAPQFDSVLAADSNLRAFQARAEQVSPAYLQTELSSIEQLANTRSRLLQVLIEYNIAIAQLEKTKGTLLEYDNVVISDELSGR